MLRSAQLKTCNCMHLGTEKAWCMSLAPKLTPEKELLLNDSIIRVRCNDNCYVFAFTRCALGALLIFFGWQFVPSSWKEGATLSFSMMLKGWTTEVPVCMDCSCGTCAAFKPGFMPDVYVYPCCSSRLALQGLWDHAELSITISAQKLWGIFYADHV